MKIFVIYFQTRFTYNFSSVSVSIARGQPFYVLQGVVCQVIRGMFPLTQSENRCLYFGDK